MKTTIEIPDDIAIRAVAAAAEHHMTLDELIARGLEMVLAETRFSLGERARKLFVTMDQLPEFSAADRFTRHDANAR